MTQDQALNILKTGANVFLTGEPGSGKTHTINEYVRYLREHGIESAITASTGIAATHIGGVTIHSWSGIGIKTSLSKYDLDRLGSSEYLIRRIGRAKVLIIDEVSMLSAETLSMVDAVCREIRQNTEPFGGLQIILVGDFFQLPPVLPARASQWQAGSKSETRARFAYGSPAWVKSKLIVCYLTEQYRQDDSDFLSVLTAIRGNNFGSDHFIHIQSRKIDYAHAPDGIPKLFSHNVDVDTVNNQMLNKLPGTAKTFTMLAHGRQSVVEALKKGCLSPEVLQLKDGAAVMFTKNNPKEGFVNGTLGTVLRFNKDTSYPIVKLKTGELIEVGPTDWTIEENARVRGKITQIPLRLAWAITVHKSQGMSMEAAVMDLSEVFEFGQGYVALSRVRRLSGVYLLGWNRQTFQVHPEILIQDESFRVNSLEAETAFAKISAGELATMQDNFVLALGGSKTKVARGVKTDTFTATLILWNQGQTIAEIAQTRKLVQSTILSHIYRLVAKEKIPRTEIVRLVTPALSKALPEIHAVFSLLGTDSLSPVFEKLKGVYSYDDLRLARLLMKTELTQ